MSVSVDGPGGGRPDSGDPEFICEEALRGRRVLIRNASLSGLGTSALALPLKFLGLVPETVVVRLAAIATLLAAVAYVVRWEIHREVLLINGAKGAAHVVIVVIEAIVALAFLLCGLVCLIWPDGIRQFIWAIVLLFGVFSLALAMVWLERHRGVESGTKAAKHCWLVNFLRFDVLEPADQVGFFKWLAEQWERVAPPGRISFLALWLCAALVSVASADLPRVFPPAYEAFEASGTAKHPPEPHEEEPESNKPAPAGGEVAALSAATPEPPTEASVDPGYYELCGKGLEPGEPASEPARAQLYDQWLGLGGLGAVFAGCARPAHRLANGVWYAAGTCEGALRSLAVDAPEAPGELLLWGPARFGLARAREGSLLGATSSQLAGEGEIYTVTTVAGTYLFMREHLSNGKGGFAGAPRRCGEIREGAVPYVKLPPALSRLVSTEIEASGLWLWPRSEKASPGGGETYLFDSVESGDSREVVGHCSSETDCELRVNGLASHSQGQGSIDVAALLEDAPAPY